MGLWCERTRFRCPFCDARPHFLEREGHQWHCSLCGYRWFAYTEKDRIFLVVNRIANDEPEGTEP